MYYMYRSLYGDGSITMYKYGDGSEYDVGKDGGG